ATVRSGAALSWANAPCCDFRRFSTVIRRIAGCDRPHSRRSEPADDASRSFQGGRGGMSATIESRPTAAATPGSAAAGRPAREGDAVRAHFRSLSRQVGGKTVAYLDGPAGTQVPRECIDAVSAYFATSNANSHGAFTASHETDQLLHEVHAATAD